MGSGLPSSHPAASQKKIQAVTSLLQFYKKFSNHSPERALSTNYSMFPLCVFNEILSSWLLVLPLVKYLGHWYIRQTWNLSKNLHRRIFGLKILHHQFHLISTVLVRKNTKKWVKMEKFTPLAKILHCRRHWRHGQIPPLCLWSLLPEIFAFSLANFRQNGWPDISSWAKCFFRYHCQPAQCQCSYIFSAGDISFNHSCITLGLTLSVEIHEWN